MVEIRRAKKSDLETITNIYNYEILNGTATFDIEPKTIDEQLLWFDKHGPSHPLYIAQLMDEVVGWACLSPWSDRRAYAETAEISFYVHQSFRSKGIGRKLLIRMDQAALELGLHTLLSRITGESHASIHLHETLGFSHIGIMKEVGSKFGKKLDVCLMQKILQAP